MTIPNRWTTTHTVETPHQMIVRYGRVDDEREPTVEDYVAALLSLSAEDLRTVLVAVSEDQRVSIAAGMRLLEKAERERAFADERVAELEREGAAAEKRADRYAALLREALVPLAVIRSWDDWFDRVREALK